MKMKKYIFILFISVILLPVSVLAAGIEVRYSCLNIDPAAQQIQMQLNIINNSEQPVVMSALKIRYYYTMQGTAEQIVNIDYTLFGSSNVNYNFQDGYLELGFTDGAGTIPCGGESGEIQLRLYKKDWSAWDQADDYSFDPVIVSPAVNNKIILYAGNTLVWGIPPVDETAPSPKVETGAAGPATPAYPG